MPDSEKVQKEKDKISIRLSKISFILSVAAGLVIVTLLVLLGMVDNAEVSRGRTDNGYSSVKNYNCNEVEDADSPIGVKKEYTFFLMKLWIGIHIFPFIQFINTWMFIWTGRIYIA